MAYQALYRKYRPSNFELVYGQDVIIKTLKNIIKNKKINHAYLFTGPRGTGKTSCAKLFAKAVNCLNPVNGDACNKCESCLSYLDNKNPDIIEMDAASNNGVDEIREIKSKINLVPSISKYKVYIIDEVHMLSIGAFNALLKTLEEPPEYVIFILATTEPQKIPSTIISRCQRFDFKNIDEINMKKCLINIAKEEKIKIDDAALNEIIINSNGGMRDAIGLLDQACAYCDSIIKKEDIENLSGNVPIDEISLLFENFLIADYKKVFDLVEKWYEQNKDFSLITNKIIAFLREGILFKKNLFTLENEFSKKIYDSLKDSEIYKLYDDFSDLYIKIQNNYHKKSIFETSIIYYIEEYEKTNNVSRETLEDKKAESSDIEIAETIEKLKKVRINNILCKSTKKQINELKSKWDNLKEYIVNDNYKLTAGLLLNAEIVAGSENGIIITFSDETMVKRLEKNYDNSKELINKISDGHYKVVYLCKDDWSKMRPYYLEKYKNNELCVQDEKELLEELKNKNKSGEINAFADLIEME